MPVNTGISARWKDRSVSICRLFHLRVKCLISREIQMANNFHLRQMENSGVQMASFFPSAVALCWGGIHVVSSSWYSHTFGFSTGSNAPVCGHL